MSHFICSCGERITDQTDFISNKSRFIADQDYFDFLDELENKSFETEAVSLHKYFQEVFQCKNCQNIIIFNQKGRFDFQPLDLQESKNIFESYLGEKWKGLIVANFYDEKGQIYWNTNATSGFIQKLSLEKLKELYYEKFEELKEMNILRSSFLRIDGEIKHKFDSE